MDVSIVTDRKAGGWVMEGPGRRYPPAERRTPRFRLVISSTFYNSGNRSLTLPLLPQGHFDYIWRFT